MRNLSIGPLRKPLLRYAICATMITTVTITMLYVYVGYNAPISYEMTINGMSNQSVNQTVIHTRPPVIQTTAPVTQSKPCYTTKRPEEQPIDFDKHSNNITGFPYPIVPDIVHLIYFRTRELDFVQMVNIRSIVRHHNPARILIHCNYCVNNTMEGKYWDMLGAEYRKVIEVVKAEEPTEIFGRYLSSVHHASDVARIRILMKYGGIFLDNDVYVVQGLHGFRHFEMALGWEHEGWMGTQVLVCHKDARFLKLWLDSYHNYQGDRWYFNAGELPTTDILFKRPELVHLVKELFGVDSLSENMYKRNWPDWTNQYTVHLLIRYINYHVPSSPVKHFDEFNIKTYDRTFGQMARLVLYGKTDMVFD